MTKGIFIFGLFLMFGVNQMVRLSHIEFLRRITFILTVANIAVSTLMCFEYYKQTDSQS